MSFEDVPSGSGKPEEELLDHPYGDCRAEALDLLAMADTLGPKFNEQLVDWRLRVDDLLAGSLRYDLETEWQVETLAVDLRRLWLNLAFAVVAGEMKTPPSASIALLPISESKLFEYERVIQPRALEAKLEKAAPEIPGWTGKVSVFGSGMAAIATVISVLRHAKGKYGRGDGEALRLDMFGGYFETLKLLDILSTSDLRCQAFQEPEPLLERFSSGKTDILFLELIAYDWKQSVFDQTRLIEALAERPADRPWVLFLDTTLLGPIFQPGPLLTACGEKRPLLVIDIRSGLKLDQVGLEFSNAGIINILSPEDLDTRRYPDAKQFHEMLASTRKVFGNALSLSQLAILDAPWIFHPDWTMRHTQSVMDNNRRLACALSGVRGLFPCVNHPSLGPRAGTSWAHSPMVVLEFHRGEDNEENHTFILAVVAHEIRKRKLVLHRGGSFGFRHHRVEIISPEIMNGPNTGYRYPDGKARGFLKVAMGARKGPSVEGTIKLMVELAAFPDFDALRLNYSQINPRQELAAFPDLNSLRLIT